MRLFADVWDNDYSSPTHKDRLGAVADVDGIWSLPGGVQSFSIRCHRRGAAAYMAYRDWIGQRLIVHDCFCDKPVLDGTIVDCQLQGQFVMAQAMGPWWRLFDDYETVPAGEANTDDVIKEALANHASIINSDQSNICSTSVNTDGYTLPVQGLHVGRLIEEMLLAGDGNGNALFFWIQPAVFDNDGKPQKPIAYMEAASTSASVDWQVWRRDKVVGSNVLARDIGDLATSVTALYDNAGTTAETAAATNNTSVYWTRKRAVSARGVTATMAAEVRDTESARLSEAQMRRSFTLGAREIMTGDGAKWPLWRLLIDGGYMRDNDQGPDKGLFDLSMDYKRVGRITDMRYGHRGRQLSMTLNGDVALDAMLATLGYNWRMVDQLKRELVPGI